MDLSGLWCFMVIILALAVPGLGSARAQAGEGKWTLVGFTKYRDAVFINKNSAATSVAGMSKVWAKIVPSEKSKFYQEIKRELGKSGKSTKGFKYTEILSETDCRGKRIRFLKIVYFTGEGATIHADAPSEAVWKSVSVGSVWENLHGAVCGS